jgi:uncharacterized protein with gpF-like domain
MADAQLTDVDPQEAIAALNKRLSNPVPTGSWLEIWQAEHSSGFTVAQSAGYDILGDIGTALDDALKNGTTFDDFVKQLMPILQAKGWWGGDLGSLRRLQLIFDMNMRTSYAAGQWARIEATKSDLPYLMYDHTTSLHPRAEHLLWDGVTLPADHPWWDTHYPPNGWSCKCGVIALTQGQVDRMSAAGLITTDAPHTIWQTFVNAVTGETSKVPAGIDPGFGYNVGKAFLAALSGG